MFSLISFLAVFEIFKLIVPSIIMVYDPFFYRFSDFDKKEYYVRIISTAHGLIAAPIAFYQLLYACEKPDETIFSSFECINTPKPIYVYLVLCSSSYILADLYWTAFVFKYTGWELYEYLWHHLMVFIACITSLILSGFALSLSAMVLIVEISNIFMNLRWYY